MAKLSQLRTRRELSAEEAAEHLSHVALGIATGEIWIESETREHALHPGSSIRMEIKGGEDREEGKLVIELSWKNGLRISGAALWGARDA